MTKHQEITEGQEEEFIASLLDATFLVFPETDKDGDGKVTREELRLSLKREAPALNGNGELAAKKSIKRIYHALIGDKDDNEIDNIFMKAEIEAISNSLDLL